MRVSSISLTTLAIIFTFSLIAPPSYAIPTPTSHNESLQFYQSHRHHQAPGPDLNLNLIANREVIQPHRSDLPPPPPPAPLCTPYIQGDICVRKKPHPPKCNPYIQGDICVGKLSRDTNEVVVGSINGTGNATVYVSSPSSSNQTISMRNSTGTGTNTTIDHHEPNLSHNTSLHNDNSTQSISGCAGVGTGVSVDGTQHDNGKNHDQKPAGDVKIVNYCPFDVRSDIVHGPIPVSKSKMRVINSGSSSTAAAAAATTTTTTGSDQGVDGHGIARANGGIMRYSYTRVSDVGVSWKLYPNDQGRNRDRDHESGPIQVEWTWVPEQKRVYWDLSLIDTHQPDRSHRPHHTNTNTTVIVTNTTISTKPLHRPHSFFPHGINIIPNIRRIPSSSPPLQPTHHENDMGNCKPVACQAGNPWCEHAYNSPDDYQAQRDCPDTVGLTVIMCPERYL